MMSRDVYKAVGLSAEQISLNDGNSPNRITIAAAESQYLRISYRLNPCSNSVCTGQSTKHDLAVAFQYTEVNTVQYVQKVAEANTKHSNFFVLEMNTLLTRCQHESLNHPNPSA